MNYTVVCSLLCVSLLLSGCGKSEQNKQDDYFQRADCMERRDDISSYVSGNCIQGDYCVVDETFYSKKYNSCLFAYSVSTQVNSGGIFQRTYHRLVDFIDLAEVSSYSCESMYGGKETCDGEEYYSKDYSIARGLIDGDEDFDPTSQKLYQEVFGE